MWLQCYNDINFVLIDSWVNEKTHGKIPEIVAYLYPGTKVLLASALYFKAMWENTFIEGATGP